MEDTYLRRGDLTILLFGMTPMVSYFSINFHHYRLQVNGPGALTDGYLFTLDAQVQVVLLGKSLVKTFLILLQGALLFVHKYDSERASGPVFAQIEVVHKSSV